MIRRLPLTVLIASLFVAGCAVGPDYQRPEINLPESHRGASPENTKAPSLADSNWREVLPILPCKA